MWWSIFFDDFDKAKIYALFSSIYESDNGDKLICAYKDLSVLDNIVFDAADVYDLLNKLDNRYTLTHNDIPRFFLQMLAAPSALSLYMRA